MPRLCLIIEDNEDGGIEMHIEDPPKLETAKDLSPAILLALGILVGFEKDGLKDLAVEVTEFLN